MINKKNLWFLTLFSLILVLSVYYITMPTELLITNNSNTEVDKSDIITNIEEVSLLEALKTEDNTETLEEINKLKETIANTETSSEDRNKAFDTLKTLNQISSKEELLEEKIKTTHDLDSFIKIEGDQIRVVIDSEEHSNTIANNIMKTIQNNFDTKQYISIQFK
jgi:stage III sporulation protein AH